MRQDYNHYPLMRKFKRGKRVENLYDLLGEIKKGRWMFLREIPKHPQVFNHMTLNTIQKFIQGGSIFYANINREYRK